VVPGVRRGAGMNGQTVIFTALPKAAIGANTVRLSVHVAPRLEPDADTTLSAFPDFADWGSADPAFKVSFAGQAPLTATVVTDPAKNPGRWSQVFGGSVGVRSGKTYPDYWDLELLSYPAAKVIFSLQNRYTALGLQHIDDPPLLADLEARFGDIGFTHEPDEKEFDDKPTADEVLTQIAADRASGVKANTFAGKPSAYDFLALAEFHAPNGKPVGATKPDLDFGELVGVLAAHPHLLRILGLVIDLEVQASALSSLPLTSTIQLSVDWKPSPAFSGTTRISLPKTTCTIDTSSGVFEAAPKLATALAHGHLPLGTPDYELITIDPDGAGLKALQFATTIKRHQLPKHRTLDTPKRAAPPTLRSAGLAVVRAERGSAFKGKLIADKGLNADVAAKAAKPGDVDATTQPVLHAEDVIRGYLIDVWTRKTQAWHSLVRRTGKYIFPDAGTADEVGLDEAATNTSATVPSDPNAERRLKLQQSLFQWFGWSLAVAPPGKPIAKDGSVDPEDVGQPPLPVEFDFHVPPQSLPRLRFGEQYGVRMRAVDLAGNAVPFDKAAAHTDQTLVRKTTYLRWEAIPSPELALRATRTEGEAVDRMVIRSDLDDSLQPLPLEPPGDNERHVVPPKGAQLLAEHHGLFDSPPGSVPSVDVAKYDLITKREAKTLIDAGGLFDPDDPANFVVPVAQLSVPYLPDPMVRGASFRNLPGTDGSVRSFRFDPAPGEGWPDLRPFRLVLTQSASNGVSPAAAPVFIQSDRVLRLELPKAHVLTLKLSSTPAAELITRLGMWQWLADAVAPANRAALRKAVETGAHWVTSPDRPLTLVHAVRRPLKTPEWKFPHVDRLLGQTFATIVDRAFVFSRRSTGKVEVFGHWTECVDAGPGTPPPSQEVLDNLAFVVPLARDATKPPDIDDDRLDVRDRHEFRDTKFREIEYRAVATTSFGEYFLSREQHAVAAQADAIQLNDGGKGLVAESVTVRNRTSGTVYGRGSDYTLDAAGAKVQLQGTIPVGQELEVSYLVPPITRETVTRRTLIVPSSARPPAPRVLYVVPTFRWPVVPALQSKRETAGVRVYLERPWHVSGCGELLGVLIWQPVSLQLDPPENLQPYVTRWGLDPLFAGGDLPVRNPGFAQFPASTPDLHGTNKSLDERDGLVSVAGHQVFYASERDLMYCDIDIDTTGSAYTPFIRLALARFQPNSLLDAHLSRVILADYVQIAPDRSVSIVPLPGRGNNIQVTLSGLSYMRNTAGVGPGTARVFVELRDPTRGAATELGWKTVAGPITLDHLPTINPIQAIWQATIALPSARTPGKFRLVIEQFETHRVQKTDDMPNVILPVAFGGKLVYSDVVPI
jgi:hypothetical protein